MRGSYCMICFFCDAGGGSIAAAPSNIIFNYRIGEYKEEE